MKHLLARTLTRWFSGSVASSAPTPRRARPGVEAFEDRLVMSASPLTINGTESADVIVMRSIQPDSQVMEIVLNGVSLGSFSRTTTSSVTINGLGGDDRIVVEYPYLIPIQIDGGGGVNTLVDARPIGGQWLITGVNSGKLGYVQDNQTITFAQMQNLSGGSSDDNFVFGPAGKITGTIQGGGGVNTLDFRQVDSASPVWVNAWEGGNVVQRVGTMFGIQTFVGNGGFIQAGNTQNTWNLGAVGEGNIVSRIPSPTGSRTDSTAITFNFKGFSDLVGGSSSDIFKFAPIHGVERAVRDPIPAFISVNGGGGSNTLDFAAESDALFVNLSKNRAIYMNSTSGAFERDFSIYNFTNVYGGSGNDILVGNSLANRLEGNNGDDILIGRDGADSLFGGFGNDALIGGFTDFDLDLAGLRDMAYSWVAPQIIKNVAYPGYYANKIRDSITFFDDFVRADRYVDALYGGPGNDRFYLWGVTGSLFNDVFDGASGDLWTYAIKAPV